MNFDGLGRASKMPHKRRVRNEIWCDNSQTVSIGKLNQKQSNVSAPPPPHEPSGSDPPPVVQTLPHCPQYAAQPELRPTQPKPRRQLRCKTTLPVVAPHRSMLSAPVFLDMPQVELPSENPFRATDIQQAFKEIEKSNYIDTISTCSKCMQKNDMWLEEMKKKNNAIKNLDNENKELIEMLREQTSLFQTRARELEERISQNKNDQTGEAQSVTENHESQDIANSQLSPNAMPFTPSAPVVSAKEEIDSARDLVTTLEEIINCGICLDRLETPVLQCVNGHGVCKKCQHNSKKCPTCAQKILTNKPILLTQLLDKLPNICAFADKGCVRLSLSGEHEPICEYRPFSCPKAECGWTGTAGVLKDHWQSQHPNSIYSYPLKYNTLIAYHQFQKINCWLSLHVVDGNMFIIKAKKEIESKRFLQWIFLVPTKKYKHDYLFSISFCDGEDVIFKYTLKAEPFNEREFKDEIPSRMMLPLDVLKKLVVRVEERLIGAVDVCRVNIEA